MKKTELWMFGRCYPHLDPKKVKFVYVQKSTRVLKLSDNREIQLEIFALSIPHNGYWHEARIRIYYDPPSNTCFVGKGSYVSRRVLDWLHEAV